ncbi:hypothetical protein KDD17_10730 [Sulfitobacter albidus]|uniref:Nuclease n=1 Tax=Sulfitobacter albidus TaxID=2829501 RepID=A0A975JBM1_9RHOB|nr:hypothetical protein [Sulfitobacter albidus]QUJ75448.1 hypothetical protein KDD17_10730 [Sulfitobacter albidus]
MLKTFRARAAAAAALLTFAAAPVSAESYQILLMDNAFFPETTYVQEGDTVTFVNLSGKPTRVTALDKSWDTGMFKDGIEISMLVSDEMSVEFVAKQRGNGGGADTDQVGYGTDGDLTNDNVFDENAEADEIDVFVGALTFDAPPEIGLDG